jgi:hypothetical protein
LATPSPHHLRQILAWELKGIAMNHKKQQNATLFEGLSPAQQKAVTALLGGRTVTAAAKAANVDRTTIYRWLRDPYDPAFRNALDQGRQELQAALKTRLLGLANNATDCLEGAMKAGDSKAALALLKGLGLL